MSTTSNYMILWHFLCFRTKWEQVPSQGVVLFPFCLPAFYSPVKVTGCKLFLNKTLVFCATHPYVLYRGRSGKEMKILWKLQHNSKLPTKGCEIRNERIIVVLNSFCEFPCVIPKEGRIPKPLIVDYFPSTYSHLTAQNTPFFYKTMINKNQRNITKPIQMCL